MKNRTTRTHRTLAAVLGMAGFLCSPALADGQCQELRATLVEVYNGGASTSGTIANGGFLNGTTVTVFPPAFVVTPNPNVVAYTGEMTITTLQGLLKISNVYLYNFATGQGTVLGRISPDTSTGRFAGATGGLFFNVRKTIGTSSLITYQQDVSGEICFAKE